MPSNDAQQTARDLRTPDVTASVDTVGERLRMAVDVKWLLPMLLTTVTGRFTFTPSCRYYYDFIHTTRDKAKNKTSKNTLQPV